MDPLSQPDKAGARFPGRLDTVLLAALLMAGSGGVAPVGAAETAASGKPKVEKENQQTAVRPLDGFTR